MLHLICWESEHLNQSKYSFLTSLELAENVGKLCSQIIIQESIFNSPQEKKSHNVKSPHSKLLNEFSRISYHVIACGYDLICRNQCSIFSSGPFLLWSLPKVLHFPPVSAGKSLLRFFPVAHHCNIFPIKLMAIAKSFAVFMGFIILPHRELNSLYRLSVSSSEILLSFTYGTSPVPEGLQPQCQLQITAGIALLLRCSCVLSVEKELHGWVTSKQLFAHFLEEVTSYWSETGEAIPFSSFLPLMRAGYGDVLIFGQALRAVLGVLPLVRC